MQDDTQQYIEKVRESKLELAKNIADNLVGTDALIDGPFESHRQTYADYAASGKAVKSIEDYLAKEVLPVYSNTHTSSSFVGIQSSCFREEARGIIRDTYRCTDNDVILFAGNGCTGAINAFVRILGIEKKKTPFNTVDLPLKCSFPGCPLSFSEPGDLRLHQRTHTDGDASSWKTNVRGSMGRIVEPVSDDPKRPIVFVGPYEHHSNLLPWREADCDYVEIGVNESGKLNKEELRQKLRQYKNRPLKIVTLNHVSNVTGIITPMSDINILVHEEHAFICWDCATACSHEAPMMNNTSVHALDYCDALFMSPHKMVGGVGCPGLLILKKKFLVNDVPNMPGGGTIFYVNKDMHRYCQVLCDREEGGTPNIMGAIRCGLALHMHNQLGWNWIREREQAYLQDTLAVLKRHPNVVVLGEDMAGERAAVFSVLIKHHGRFLHWNFVSMLLSDLFGIQTRSGCMCAGPYSMRLLGINASKSHDLDQILLDKNEIFRPGYTRISLSYVMTPEEVKFIQDALIFVSEEGWKFLPEYIFYEDTGEWRHKSIKNKKPFRRWLNDVDFTSGRLAYTPKAHEVTGVAQTELFASYLEQARATLARTLAVIRAPAYVVSDYTASNVRNEESSLIAQYRWYVTRIEAYEDIKQDYAPTASEPLLPAILVHPNAVMQDESKSMKRPVSEVPVVAPLPKLTAAAKMMGKTVPTMATVPKKAATRLTDGVAGKTITRESCLVSGSGRDVLPVAAVPILEEEGVEFKYHTGPDGVLEYTAVVPGLPFKERVKFMKKHKDLFPEVPPRIMKSMGEAIGQYGMIKEGDKVMLGLSGGKDSLTMLHCLLALQRRSPVKFELACVTVDPQTTGFDPSPLRDYCKTIGVKYFYESRAVIALAKKKLKNGSICSWCSRMKRGILYSTLRREGYNVLVLAQHLDDLAESFLMSVFHNGILRTMKACYLNKEKDIRIIRPFVYVREKQLREFAKTVKLPIIDENCPACFEGPKERYRMKTLLAAEENLFPSVFNCILSAIIPLMRHNSAIGCAIERKTPREMRSEFAHGGKKEDEKMDVEDDEDEDEDEGYETFQ